MLNIEFYSCCQTSGDLSNFDPTRCFEANGCKGLLRVNKVDRICSAENLKNVLNKQLNEFTDPEIDPSKRR